MRKSLFVLLAFMYCTPALAEEGGGTDAAQRLPEVLVSASLEPTEVKKLAATVQVLTAEDIAATGAVTLNQALDRLVPGNGYTQPGALSAVGMRGFRSNQNAGTTIGDRVLVLVDGHRAGTGNPAVISLANVERIEIVRGPASVMYGGSAMGGVINLITRRGKGPLKGAVGASYGSFERGTAEFSLSGGMDDDRYGYSMAVQGFTSGEYKDGKGELYTNTNANNFGASGTATLRPTTASSLSMVGAHQTVLETGSPGYYPRGLTPDDTVDNTYSYLALEYENGRADKNPDDVTFRASLYGSENRYNIYDAQYGGGNTTYLSYSLGARGMLGLPLGDFGRLAIGAEYSRMEDSNYGDSVWQPNSTYDVMSVFAEHRVDVGSLSANYGLRYDVYATHLKHTNQLDVRSDTTTYDNLSWSAGATWWVLDWLGVRASAGSAFVPPTARTLAGSFQTGGFWAMKYKGNPDLEPEKSISAEVGLELEVKDFQASVAFFHTRFQDRIIEMPQGDHFTFTNSGDQRLSGINASLRWKYGLDVGAKHELVLSPYANGEFYTQRHSRDETPVMAVPEYSAVAGMGFTFDKVHLDVNARFTGAQKQINTVYPYAPVTMGDYATLNARLTFSPTDNLDVFLDAANLTNTYATPTLGYPTPGLTASVGFKYRF